MLPEDQRVIHFGLFAVDVSAGELYRKGRKVALQEKPFQILTLLLDRPGEVVSREEVRQKLWVQDTFVDFDAGVNTAIRKLRAALGDSAENPRFIETLPRHGYRFIAPVNGEDPVNAVVAATAPKISQPLQRRRLIPVAGIAVVAFLGVTALVGLNIRSRHKTLSSTVKSGQIHSLAVLPLENLTGDPNQEYFVDGMHDALITELGQVSGLHVISRASVMHYKGTKVTVPQVAQELNVDAVIEGAVARSGQRVRITAQLIDARNEGHLWAKSYERDLSDVLALQEEVAREIATAAKVGLATQERRLFENPRQVDPEAYDAFLKGIRALGLGSGGGDVKGLDQAISYFEESTKKQPNFALPYAYLALTYYQFSFGGTQAPDEFMPKAEAAARRALELDEENSVAHFTLAAILFRYRWDWVAAENEYRQAMELPPSWPRPGWVDFLFLTGRAEEALAEAQQEREREPLLTQPKLHVGRALRAAGRYDEAIKEIGRAVEESPRRPLYNYELGVTYVLKGELNHGIANLEKAVELSKAIGLSDGNHRYGAYLGYAYAMAGRTSEARGILRNLQALSQQQYVSSYGIALIHLGLGEKEALNWLEKAYEAHAYELAELAWDPRLNPLRSNPRFQDLTQRVGPPPAMLANQTRQR
jgi:TolB-like protein/DNA-binding winged helix-turn-helix (wHTH) protein/Flp pilus assembly protein TadD